MDSIALAQPALSLAAKVQARASITGPETGEGIGERLWNLVLEARAAGIDAEAALRSVALAKIDKFRAAEDETAEDEAADDEAAEDEAAEDETADDDTAEDDVAE